MKLGSILPRGKQGSWSPTTLASAFFLLSVLLKLATGLWLRRLSAQGVHDYSYIGYDYPETWPIERKQVKMSFGHSFRYALDTPGGLAEWSTLVPGDGVIHLGEHKHAYMTSMFHQLKCLDIIRAQLVDGFDPEEGPNDLATHCMNYIRQMVLCRGDTYIEPYIHPNHEDPIEMNSFYECKDWGAVYEETEKNQKEYAQWLEARGGAYKDEYDL